jgi:hypothetical protein
MRYLLSSCLLLCALFATGGVEISVEGDVIVEDVLSSENGMQRIEVVNYLDQKLEVFKKIVFFDSVIIIILSV